MNKKIIGLIAVLIATAIIMILLENKDYKVSEAKKVCLNGTLYEEKIVFNNSNEIIDIVTILVLENGKTKTCENKLNKR